MGYWGRSEFSAFAEVGVGIKQRQIRASTYLNLSMLHVINILHTSFIEICDM
jgi:hypothetical protein